MLLHHAFYQFLFYLKNDACSNFILLASLVFVRFFTWFILKVCLFAFHCTRFLFILWFTIFYIFYVYVHFLLAPIYFTRAYVCSYCASKSFVIILLKTTCACILRPTSFYLLGLLFSLKQIFKPTRYMGDSPVFFIYSI